jgi:hypothetical protein
VYNNVCIVAGRHADCTILSILRLLASSARDSRGSIIAGPFVLELHIIHTSLHTFVYDTVDFSTLYLHAYNPVFSCFSLFLLFLFYMLLFSDLCFCLLVFLDGVLVGSFLLAGVRPLQYIKVK